MDKQIYQSIIGTLGFIVSADGRKTLLVHRNARDDDQHIGKYNGLGGKLEEGEDIVTCMRREIMEEAGITCGQMELRGTVHWPGFGPNGENWLGFIFLIHSFTGTPKIRNEEGELAWHTIESLPQLPMWEGDKYFLPLVFDGDPRQFHGHMPYDHGRPVSWQYSRC